MDDDERKAALQHMPMTKPSGIVWAAQNPGNGRRFLGSVVER